MSKKQISIIGGPGQMGQLFTRLLGELGHQIQSIGINDWDNLQSRLCHSDLVIVSVPIASTLSVIQQLAPLLPAHCILCDFTSIKVEPLLAMLSCHSGPVLGLHPMFGPTIKSTSTQVIVHCSGRHSAAAQWLLDDILRLGFTLKEMSASAHDQAMSFIQGLEHFLTFCLGSFLKHKGQHPEQLQEIASPIYLAKLMLLGRIFHQDANLYASIISANPQRITLLREFSTWIAHWVTELECNNQQAFVNEFNNTKQWMGKFTAAAQKISDEFLLHPYLAV